MSVETALPVDTPVSVKRVVETGSPTLKERTASAVSEWAGVVHSALLKSFKPDTNSVLNTARVSSTKQSNVRDVGIVRYGILTDSGMEVELILAVIFAWGSSY